MTLIRRHIIAVCALVTVIVAITWPHISGQITFIGDSDRLNTFLNIKLAETISIQEYGRVPSWNENSFMGFNMRGLYWMFPGWNPDAWLHSVLSIENLYWNAGIVSFVLLLLAMLCAYAYLWNLTADVSASIAGACMYGLSSLSLGRISQVDSAYLTFILLPLGFLALRRLEVKNWRQNFVLLAFVVWGMLSLAFLQEAAYALVLLGCYAIFTSISKRAPQTLVIFGASATVGILLSLPRLITVAREFQLMFRTTQPSHTGANEFFRFFHDGIFGRYWQEAWDVLGNVGFNVHEGLQIYSSTVASGMVFLVFLLVDNKKFSIPLKFFLATIVAVAFSMKWRLGLMAGIALLAILWFLWSCKDKNEWRVVEVRESSEFTFHLISISLVLAFVLVPICRSILYYAFFKIDFLHSRVVIAGLLPMAAVMSLLIAGLRDGALKFNLCGFKRSYCHLLYVLIGISLVSIIHFGMHWWDQGAEDKKVAFGNLNFSRMIFWRTAILLLIVSVIVWIIRNPRFQAMRGPLAIIVSAAIVMEAGLYAKVRLLGEHTRTYPIAFQSGNYFSAPRDVLNPPSQKCRQRLQDKLDNKKYRTIVIANADQFQPFVAPHLSQFWQIRLLDGYPGLPLSIANLPWPSGIAGLRSVGFRSKEGIPWELLAILNVRNAIIADKALYHNVTSSSDDCLSVSEIKIQNNPFPVVPRHYFVSKVSGVAAVSEILPIEDLRVRVIGEGKAEIKWWPQISDGDVEIQVRPAGHDSFSTVARHSPLSATSQLVPNLQSGHEYEVRALKIRRGARIFETRPIRFEMKDNPGGVDLSEGFNASALVKKAFPYEVRTTAVVEGLDDTRAYEDSGNIDAEYRGDSVRYSFEPNENSRFLVVNELYHPDWQAYISGKEQRIYPVNRVMRGVEIPRGATSVEFRFVPFSESAKAKAITLVATGLFIVFLLFGGRMFTVKQ